MSSRVSGDPHGVGGHQIQNSTVETFSHKKHDLSGVNKLVYKKFDVKPFRASYGADVY